MDAQELTLRLFWSFWALTALESSNSNAGATLSTHTSPEKEVQLYKKKVTLVKKSGTTSAIPVSCHNGAVCNNTAGGHTCSCPAKTAAVAHTTADVQQTLGGLSATVRSLESMTWC